MLNLVVQQTTSAAFLQDGTWWLALGGIISTLSVGVATAILANNRAKADREFHGQQMQADRDLQQSLLNLQLDRQRGIGLHDEFLLELDRIDETLEAMMTTDGNIRYGPLSLVALDEILEPGERKVHVIPGALESQLRVHNLHELGRDVQRLCERGWTAAIRDQAEALNLAVSNYWEAAVSLRDMWDTPVNDERAPSPIDSDQAETETQDLLSLHDQAWSHSYLLRQVISEN